MLKYLLLVILSMIPLSFYAQNNSSSRPKESFETFICNFRTDSTFKKERCLVNVQTQLDYSFVYCEGFAYYGFDSHQSYDTILLLQITPNQILFSSIIKSNELWYLSESISDNDKLVNMNKNGLLTYLQHFISDSEFRQKNSRDTVDFKIWNLDATDFEIRKITRVESYVDSNVIERGFALLFPNDKTLQLKDKYNFHVIHSGGVSYGFVFEYVDCKWLMTEMWDASN